MRPASAMVLIVLTLVVTACGRGGAEGAPTPSASSALAAPSAAGGPTKPMMKEYQETPVDRLGKLAPGTGIPVGSKIPAVGALDLDGHPVAIGDLAARGPILLVFYRGGWCPYCNFEIHELSKAYPEYQKRGVTPVAVSVDKPDEAAKTEATYTIPFPVLSDSDLTVHEAFHVVHRADEAEVSRLWDYGIDLARSSGRTHHAFALPALFLIDREGMVRWAHADPDYKVRPRTAQILAAIDAAKL